MWCNSGKMIVQQWNSDNGTVWWKSTRVMVEQCSGTVEQWNSVGGTVWCNSGTVIVEQ